MSTSSSQRVLVTGGASGLGLALAKAFLADGHRVCITDVNVSRGTEALTALSGSGDTLTFQALDVRRYEDFVIVLDNMEQQWGGCDVIVNNAGVASGGPFDWLSGDDWAYVMDINFGGVLNGCRSWVPTARKRGSGTIINIASMAGLLNPAGMSNYNVSKAAVVSLSETLAVELAPFGIKVMCVCPSFFKTNLAESMRSPDAASTESLAALLDNSSELTADDIATMVIKAWKAADFLVLPHEKARQAWHFKQRDLTAYHQATAGIAESVARKARRNPADSDPSSGN